jgi:hypothetical protein
LSCLPAQTRGPGAVFTKSLTSCRIMEAQELKWVNFCAFFASKWKNLSTFNFQLWTFPYLCAEKV